MAAPAQRIPALGETDVFNMQNIGIHFAHVKLEVPSGVLDVVFTKRNSKLVVRGATDSGIFWSHLWLRHLAVVSWCHHIQWCHLVGFTCTKVAQGTALRILVL